VSGNAIYGNATGILGSVSFWWSQRLTGRIENNLIYDNAERGIRIGEAAGFDVINNTVYQPVGDAIRVESGSTGVRLRNNIIQVDAGHGLSVAQDSQGGFASDRNLLHEAGPSAFSGLWDDSSQDTLADWQAASGQDLVSISADPLFRDRDGGDNELGFSGGHDGGLDDNFHLRQLSPAIDRGDALAAPATDAEGLARRDDDGTPNFGTPMDSFVDLGAYEFQGSSLDTTPPVVDGTVIRRGTPQSPLTQVDVVFSEPVDPIDALAPANYELREAGADSEFDTGDDTLYALAPAYSPGSMRVVLDVIVPGGGLLPEGNFRFRVSGSTSIHDLSGLRLDGDGDGIEGGDDVSANRTPTLAPIGDRTVQAAQPLTFTASAVDPDGDALRFSLDPGAPAGAAIDDSGIFTWTPTLLQGGVEYLVTLRVTDDGDPGLSDAQSVRILVSGTQLNIAPVATDDAFALAEDTVLVVGASGVLATDSDEDGDALSAVLVTGPVHAADFTLNADGSFLYTPAANFNGTDSFTYLAFDGTDASEPATVTIGVTPAQDPPLLADLDNVITNEGTLLQLSVSASDPDPGDTLVFSLALAPAGASIDPATGLIDWVAVDGDADYDFVVGVTDSDGLSDTGGLRVHVRNVAPQLQSLALPGQIDENESFTLGGTIEDPAASDVLTLEVDWGDGLQERIELPPGERAFALPHTYADDGSYPVTLRVTDDDLGESAHSLSVVVVNRAPAAAEDSYATREDDVLTVDAASGVLFNDVDTAADTLTALLVSGPQFGTLELAENGGFTYTPSADFFGSDSFTYVASDGLDASAPATVAIRIDAVNDAPEVATLADQVLMEGQTLRLTGSFSDPDPGDSWTASVSYGDGGGAQPLALNGNAFQLEHLYAGDGVFDVTVTVTDLDLADGSHVLRVNVANLAPLAQADAYEVKENEVLTVTAPGVLANDSDVQGDALSTQLVAGPQFGTLELEASGAFVYRPNPGFSGTDSFRYAAFDGSDASEAIVSIEVQPNNHAPRFVSEPPLRFELAPLVAGDAGQAVFQALGPAGQSVSVHFEWTVREPGHDNEIGVYRVDDAQGRVDRLAPGEAGYAQVALQRAQIVRASGQGAGAARDLALEGSAHYAFYLVRDASAEEWLCRNPRNELNRRPLALFSIVEANPDGSDHLRAQFDESGALRLSWEDVTGRGDRNLGEMNLRAMGFAPPQALAFQYLAQAEDADADTLTYSLQEGPPGAAIDALTGLLTWLPREPGSYRFRLLVDDGRGGSDEQSFELEVVRPERVLEIVGTECDDTISVKQRDGRIWVTFNGEKSVHDGISAILVRTLAGDDRIELSGLAVDTRVQAGAGNDRIDARQVCEADLWLEGETGCDTIRAGGGVNLIDGGSGNDHLQAGRGDSILVGGEGNDWLHGGAGRDLLIGGAGSDRLDGGAGQDVLIGGATVYDAAAQALLALHQEWRRTDLDYSARLEHLTLGGGHNGGTVLGAGQFIADHTRDQLRGNGGRDAYLGVDHDDQLTDWRHDEARQPGLDTTSAQRSPVIDWSIARGAATVSQCPRPAWLRDFVLDLARDEDARNPNGKIRIVGRV
jgi:parallel beta-helix repeat protein/VCBS repeat-containing protein